MRRMALVFVILVSGCTSYRLTKLDPPPIAALARPPAGLGQICVLRPHWLASAVTFVVHDNQVLVGATRGPTYFCYFAEPGVHQITSEADSVEEAVVTVEPEGRYYLHQIVDNIVGFVRSRLVWVDSLEAAGLVEKCGYRALVGVPGKEVLPKIPTVVSATPARPPGS